MLQMVPQLLLDLPLFLVTAVATHVVMSFAQTLMHYKLGHNPMGGRFFRNHINFHHTYYSKDHLVSRTYLGDEGNNTPFFFIPVILVGACTYLVLPADLFVVQLIACAASFYAHVFFDKEYHVEGSRLQRFGWFRRKQELHFVHHRHAGSNFAMIHFVWDKFLGTYGRPGSAELPPLKLDHLVGTVKQRLGHGDAERFEACNERVEHHFLWVGRRLGTGSSPLAPLRVASIFVTSTSEFEYGQGHCEVVQPDQRVWIYSTGGRGWEGRFRSHLGR